MGTLIAAIFVIIDGGAERSPTEFVVTGTEAELTTSSAHKVRKPEEAKEGPAQKRGGSGDDPPLPGSNARQWDGWRAFVFLFFIFFSTRLLSTESSKK